MRIAHVMAGARTGGAELFFERLTAAQGRTGESVLAVIRRDAGRAARMRAAGVAPVELGFGGVLDFATAAGGAAGVAGGSGRRWRWLG